MREITFHRARYRVESEREEYKGFGGRRFSIRFLDGALWRTSNLWLDYAYGHVDNPDTCTIHDGWGETSEKNLCEWMKREDGIFTFGSAEPNRLGLRA